MVGLCHSFIDCFAEFAEPLVQLTQKDIPFQFRELRVHTQQRLKDAVLASGAIRSLIYVHGVPIILVVDTSNICIGFILMQPSPGNPSI